MGPEVAPAGRRVRTGFAFESALFAAEGVAAAAPAWVSWITE
jgi:hypothetical protein